MILFINKNINCKKTLSYLRHLPVNAFGKRSETLAVKASPFALLMMTTISSPNSIRLCRHMPQGDTGSAAFPTIAIASNSCSPEAMALARAALSAQMPAPEAALSILPAE